MSPPPPRLEFERQLRIASVTIERGYLDTSEVVRVLSQLEGSPEADDITLWLDGGGLTMVQLMEVLEEVDGPETVMRSTRLQRSKPPTSSRRQPLASLRSPSFDPGATVRPPALSGAVTKKAPRTLSVAPPSGRQRFRIVSSLGKGSMGEVWECVDERLGRRVAVKVARTDVPNPSVAARMLERECRIAGRLEHPNIMPIYDAGHLDDGRPFYAMRIIENETLADLMRRSVRNAHELIHRRLRAMMRTFLSVCSAVDYAHSKGVIHCDLKPAHIVLGQFDEVLVVDWGMAYSLDEGLGFRGGTPAYMAPEQFSPDARSFDARTDIFALGAILYEILCGQPPYPEASVSAVENLSGPPRKAGPPAAPTQVCPGREIPEELVQTCMKALSDNPEERHQSVRAFSAALEAFVQGSRAEARRRQRAQQRAKRACELGEDFARLQEYVRTSTKGYDELKEQIPPWEKPDAKEQLWRWEERLLVLRRLADLSFTNSLANYEEALEHMPELPSARSGLKHLATSLAKEAPTPQNLARNEAIGSLCQRFPQAAPAVHRQQAECSIRLPPDCGSATLSTYQERGRRLLICEQSHLAVSGELRLKLAPGRYRLTAKRGNGRWLWLPLYVAPFGAEDWSEDLRQAPELTAGEVWIPGGKALLGGCNGHPCGSELLRTDVPGFALQALPTTMGQYLEFLTSLYASGANNAEMHTPLDPSGEPYYAWKGGKLTATEKLWWGFDWDATTELPAFGIRIASARAYAQWLSARSGKHYRLPTEREWEKAARGVDGRIYPWGNQFDAAFCKMRQSREGIPHPERCGVFVDDCSPYNVRDLAGGMGEWVEQDGGGSARSAISKGGAWCDWSSDCASHARRRYDAELHSRRVGFRLARSLS